MKAKVIMKVIEKLKSAWQEKLSKFETVGLSNKRVELAKNKLEPILAGIFGYHALLYTDKAKQLVSDKLCVQNAMLISDQLNNAVQHNGSDLICRYEELPIASDMIDLLVLPDILQRSQAPHQILRECERVLIPEGHVILLIANPISWLSIKNRLIYFITQQQNKPKAIGRLRLNDWFRLLGFELVSEVPVCITDQKIQQRDSYSWFKKLSTFICNYLSGYYIIVAKKKVSTMIPIRPSWRSNKKLVRPRIAEPSVKINVKNCVKQITR